MTHIAEPVSLSLNGVDNVGKSTQLRWLARGIPGAHLVGTVDGWDSRWEGFAAGDFARWWFVDSSTAEHVGLLLGSHDSRRAGSEAMALEDRGLPMLRATCAATAAIKDGVSAPEALQLVDRLAADLPTAGPRQELHILMRRRIDPLQEASEALRRESNPGERYSAYQRALAEVVFLQAERGEYHAVLDIGDGAILDVQRRLRECLVDFGVAVASLPDHNLDRLWVLAGMSEGGKSTVAELLRDEHGVSRLKIGYLLEIAALRAGVPDPYQWSEPEQAERLTEEVLAFALASKAHTISLESAHRCEATAHLKRIWGNGCRVVYVDADPAIRMSRTVETEAELRARDATKHERGADQIANIADHVIDNSGPLSALKLSVERLVSAADLPYVAAQVTGPITCHRWLEQATEHLVDEHVALVLATGSTGTTSWRDGWSDLDLLVVRDTLSVNWFRHTIGTLPTPGGIKVGVSAFTIGDIETLRVPPRVIQSLRRAARGTGVLHRRDDYLIPVPTHSNADRTSRGELGLVLMTSRRLLTAADVDVDVRAVHKHLVLLAKILLRADGEDIDDAEEVLAAFRERHPAAGCTPPDLGALIRQPHDRGLREHLMTVTDRMLTYMDRLDRMTGNLT
jgi:hypothetical protein